ncbi:hypothetical protein [Sulfuricystis thermophila]|uniref:hypothetical protein n=1 Tax=Sulfuricystis thermophila TaxID=2496847 RepID=UPI0010361229|nr:hypothetical protein [Sulfuricystis thermophila]
MLEDAPPSAAATQRPIRCAIYARVSVADSERRELTSIAAQVEACEQFIISRRGMGWIVSAAACSIWPICCRCLPYIDAAWNLFTEWTQADTLFRLISRVTVYPDRAGIQIDLPALAQLINGIAQDRQCAKGKTRPKRT